MKLVPAKPIDTVSRMTTILDGCVIRKIKITEDLYSRDQATRIKAARKANGLTLKDCAAKLGITMTDLSALETGRLRIPNDTLLRAVIAAIGKTELDREMEAAEPGGTGCGCSASCGHHPLPTMDEQERSACARERANRNRESELARNARASGKDKVERR